MGILVVLLEAQFILLAVSYVERINIAKLFAMMSKASRLQTSHALNFLKRNTAMKEFNSNGTWFLSKV